MVIKLNGGLGSSMGLPGPKSLLAVKPGMSFLDVLARQVLALREQEVPHRLPLVLMNSAASRDASLQVLGGYSGLRVPGVPLDFLQGREPKIRADDWLPARSTASRRELEWCPPGHGDCTRRWRRPARWRPCSAPGCGTPCLQLRQPRRARRRPDRRLARREQVPFAMEAVRGTGRP